MLGGPHLLSKHSLVFCRNIDNLNVLRGVAPVLCQGERGIPFSLVTDGDFLATIHSMLRLRGLDTAKVSKVKRHADQFMVAD